MTELQREPFPFREFEPKWQKVWEDRRVFCAADPVADPEAADKPKYYILDMFPYPSGAGLHVGHPEGYTATDMLARYKRMKGFNVLHPMGWDAFGLPAEQYAIQTGTHPRITTKKNIDNFRKQIKRLGFSYDWDREINTTDEHYFKWTQWIFLKLYEKGLAYQAEAPVWWCEELGCVLANEEVIDGKSERGGYPVVRRPMRQWMLKITAYADRLLEDLDSLDWPDAIKEMQRNWIGKSVGAEVDFQVTTNRSEQKIIKVFTTRPDTLFGATYMVLAPEHPIVDCITTDEQKQSVEAYRLSASGKSELERTELNKTKSGVFTGSYAVNPVNNAKVPVWIADYVLSTYGTGAIMAVPAHDERDHEFAKKFELPIIQVVKPLSDEPVDIQNAAFSGTGISVNSDFLNGLKTTDAKDKIIRWLEDQLKGKATVNFKLRDWLFSRQRYWGEPIPVVLDQEGKPEPLKESDLPLVLPDMDDFKPSKSGEPPLSKALEWVNTTDAAGKSVMRETNTMPQWAGSCWYYLRYIDPKNETSLIDPRREKYWMNVDLYVGGAEHAVLHLLYARFWHKVLYDLGVVSSKEPFQKLVNQGIILGEDGQKMSKSRGNVVNPDEVIDLYGADSMRLFEMFMGPLEQSKAWSMTGVQGVHRFLAKVWRMLIDGEGNLKDEVTDIEADKASLKLIHALIKKVTDDLDRMAFNTAISAFMIFTNEFTKFEKKPLSVVREFLILLSPFAPHLAEELWEKTGGEGLACGQTWPDYDEKFLMQDEITVIVQVNGKVRAKMSAAPGISSDAMEKLALEQKDVIRSIGDLKVQKVIVVPGKLVNIVVK